MSFRPASNGIENSNYFVETTTATESHAFVFTILEQSPYAGDAYVDIVDACANAGLPVAPPLANDSGERMAPVGLKPAMLQLRLPGAHVFNPTRRQVAALGRLIARLHQACEHLAGDVPNHPRDGEWLVQIAGVVKGFIPHSTWRLIQDAVQRVTSMLARTDIQGLPSGVVHGDLFRDNVLFDEGGLTGVLDFHHAATAPLIYDLAVAANDWCADVNGRVDPERVLALIGAYHAIRPLTQTEIWFFSNFALYAAVAFWLSRLAVALDADNAATVRFKNPEEFQRIVENHMAGAFYIDPRLFASSK